MIAIGCDHAGYGLKSAVMEYLDENNIKYTDYGTYSADPVDYPIFASKVTEAVLDGSCYRGILICGTGIGISIAANRKKGIRAAVCTDVFSAKQTRLHNDANILALGARVIGGGAAIEIVKAFLETEFSNGADHVNRISMLD